MYCIRLSIYWKQYAVHYYIPENCRTSLLTRKVKTRLNGQVSFQLSGCSTLFITFRKMMPGSKWYFFQLLKDRKFLRHFGLFIYLAVKKPMYKSISFPVATFIPTINNPKFWKVSLEAKWRLCFTCASNIYLQHLTKKIVFLPYSEKTGSSVTKAKLISWNQSPCYTTTQQTVWEAIRIG